jgi:hypothetical protein
MNFIAETVLAVVTFLFTSQWMATEPVLNG